MAAQGMSRRQTPVPVSTLAFWLAALAAGALSLAAALAGLSTHGSARAGPDAAAEAASRNQRIAFFEGRAAADPIDYLSLNVLAGEYLQRARETGNVDDYSRAGYAATRSLELVPLDNYGGSVNLASVRLVQHDYAGARESAEQAIALKPQGPAGYGVLGDALLGLGRYNEAATAYDVMVREEATLPALSRLAGLAFVRGDQLNAVDFWKQALSTAKGLPVENQAWARSQLASVYFAGGDLKDAEKQLRRSLAAYPDYIPAIAGLANVRATQGRYDDAIGLYTRAVERLPQPQYVIALADAYAAAGRPEEAGQQYALVEAIDALYRASGINTDLQLALFYADHNRDLARALAMAEATYEESPNVYSAGAYAWALYKNGRYAEAEARSVESLRLGTPDASLHYYAAKIAFALGKNEEAGSQIGRALKLNPHFSLLHAADARALHEDLRNAR